MSALESLLLWAFGAALTLWSILAAVILATRVLHDRRQRELRSIRRLLQSAGVASEAAGKVLLTRGAQSILATTRLHRRPLERVAADSSTPVWLAELLSLHLLVKWGANRLVRQASSHRGQAGKWRRVAALRILSQAGYAGGLLQLLKRALRAADSDVVEAAVVILGRMADVRAARLLVEALRAGRHPPSRIASQLDRFPLPIGEELRPLLRDREPITRYWGAALLARYPVTPEIEAELVRLAEDTEPKVRKAAIATLGHTKAPATVSVALKHLADSVGFVRAHAARALGQFARRDVALEVARLLADTDWWVRAGAKESLQAMGEAAVEVLPGFLDHPDAFARNGAAEVLQNIGFLDRLLREAGEEPPGGEKRAILRKALIAGKLQLLEALVERADPRLAPEILRIVAELGLREAVSV